MTRTKRRVLTRRILLLLLPTVLMITAVLVLMGWRFPTRVTIDLTASRVLFAVGGSEPVRLVRSVAVRSVTVERFARVTFSPEHLELADPARRGSNRDRPAEPAWKLVAITPPVLIESDDETLQPALTFESASSDQNADPTFGPLWVRPTARVTIEMRSLPDGNPTIQVAGQPSSAVVSLPGSFQLMASYARASGIAGVPRADLLMYRGRLSTASPFVEVVSQPSAFVASLTLRPDTAGDLFSTSGIPVTAASFTQQGPRGTAETALTGDAEVAYPDYPAVAAARVKATDAIVLDGLHQFRIEEISGAAEGKGLHLRMSGVASRVTAGSPEFMRDHRLTRFDAVWRSPGLVALFGIAVWAFGTTLGGYRLYREIRSR